MATGWIDALAESRIVSLFMWHSWSLPLGKPVAFRSTYIIRRLEVAMTSGFASLVIALALCPALVSFAGFPKVTTVEPETGRVGDLISAKGENLDKSSIGEVYLTDGAHDHSADTRVDPLGFKGRMQCRLGFMLLVL
jgi:hypothetical protein